MRKAVTAEAGGRPWALETRGLTEALRRPRGPWTGLTNWRCRAGQIRGLIGPKRVRQVPRQSTCSRVSTGPGTAGEIHLCGLRTDRLRPAPDHGLRRGAYLPDLEALRPHDRARGTCLPPGLGRASIGGSDRADGPRSVTRRTPAPRFPSRSTACAHDQARELSGGQSNARPRSPGPLMVQAAPPGSSWTSLSRGVHPTIRDIIMEAIIRMNSRRGE